MTEMLNREKLQPHLVNLIAGLRRVDVELAVGLLLDYIDAVPADNCRRTENLQETQAGLETAGGAGRPQGDRFHELRAALAAGATSALYVDSTVDDRWEQHQALASACHRELLQALLDAADWRPQFDCMVPKQEELTIQFCAEIAGPRGQKGSPPDPVRLLEMAQALYEAEREGARP